MKYLSVCSGIEAATVAWHPLGWEPVAFSEIEKFPSQVLQHHYPTVPNMGDMTKYKEWNLGSIDLLVGGTPCQSFSVAGLRKGLDDPRGNLALVYCGILDHFRPKWFIWENVPGVLSSNGGRDFGSFLGAVAELGYGFAYRVLDAQFFGVAQRRRRVFVVGHLGDWRRAASVLFEPKSLSRDTAPSREKGKAIAPGFTSSIDQNGLQRTVGTLCADTHPGAYSGQDAYTGRLIPCSTYDMRQHHNPQESDTVQLTTQNCSMIRGDTPLVAFDGYNQTLSDTSQTIRADKSDGDHVGMVMQPVAVDVYNQAINGQTAATLTQACGGTNTSGPKVMQPVAFGVGESPDVGHGLRSGASRADKHESTTYVAQSMAVRRLTPVECERLQGFPDNYTNIKENCPDGPRYKAIGNSMAVPVMRWIGKRIDLFSKTK